MEPSNTQSSGARPTEASITTNITGRDALERFVFAISEPQVLNFDLLHRYHHCLRERSQARKTMESTLTASAVASKTTAVPYGSGSGILGA
jgi:hypothetical protein